MTTRQLVLAVLAAAVTLTSVAAASPEAAKQRVAITAQGPGDPTSSGTFVLIPLQAGALEIDRGTETSTWTTRVVMRKGQRIEIVNWVTTCKGKRGTLVLRLRIEHVDAGNDTWSARARGRSCEARGSTQGLPAVAGLAMRTATAGPGASAARASSPFTDAPSTVLLDASATR